MKSMNYYFGSNTVADAASDVTVAAMYFVVAAVSIINANMLNFQIIQDYGIFLKKDL